MRRLADDDGDSSYRLLYSLHYLLTYTYTYTYRSIYAHRHNRKAQGDEEGSLHSRRVAAAGSATCLPDLLTCPSQSVRAFVGNFHKIKHPRRKGGGEIS